MLQAFSSDKSFRDNTIDRQYIVSTLKFVILTSMIFLQEQPDNFFN